MELGKEVMPDMHHFHLKNFPYNDIDKWIDWNELVILESKPMGYDVIVPIIVNGKWNIKN